MAASRVSAWTFEAVRDAALNLDADDREYLAAELLASLGPDPAEDSAWGVEIKRRLEELDGGAAVLLDADEIEARVWGSHLPDD